MPEIKLTRVVSCSSEDKQYPAENLLRQQTYKKWKCKPGEKQAFVILQLEKASRIQSLDIGNEGSAFVEVLGGRSSTNEDDYKVILSTAGFMTPEDSRKEVNLNSVRFFTSEKFTKEGRDEKWDRIKLICTQPFNKDLSFGLSFVKIHATPTVEEIGVENPTVIGKFRLKSDVDESGISNAAKSDFAPGALFSAKRKAAESQGTCSPTLPTSAATSSTNSKGAPLKMDVKRKLPVTKKDNSENAKEFAKTSSSSKKKATVSNGVAGPVVANNSSKIVPFRKLFDGVVFILSGFENPLRSQLRDLAVEMGAVYKPAWGAGCTHLITAFFNTPKYRQVKGEGKIVKKEWLLDSHKRRRKLNWKKYAFEDSDEFADEEELIADDAKPGSTVAPDSELPSDVSNTVKPSSSTDSRMAKKPKMSTMPEDVDIFNASTDCSDHSSSGYNTDDEIKRVRSAQQKASAAEAMPRSSATSTTPKQINPKSSVAVDEQKGELPTLPEFFRGMRFYLYGGFPDAERKQLNRFIVAFDGVVESYMGAKITHVITRENWDQSFDEALQDFPKIVFLRPEFILACSHCDKMVDLNEYKVKKRND